MNSENYQKVQQIFQSALDREPHEREAFLKEVCADDNGLRREVEELLSAFSSSESFLERPAVAEVAEVIMEKEERLKKGDTFSHYRIVKIIGAGGMGEVYLAEDTKLRRQIALKVLPESIANDQERLRRFQQEAFAASALNHPNILTIFEFGAEGDTHFLASEFVAGETLRQRLDKGNLTVSDALEIALQIASALQVAHAAGIIHRDIKPENVMIRADGLVKLLDFGIAKLTEKGRKGKGEIGNLGEDEATLAMSPPLPISPSPYLSTSPGMIIGTANYMSPEQAKGKEIDARSDIFSFGIVLYEMLTGKRAFTGENALDAIGAILYKEPVPLNQILPEVSREIERIVNKTLRKDREERYQTALDLLTDLKDAQQELAFRGKFELTTASPAEEPEIQVIAAPTSNVPQTTSNAEFITQEIRKHRLGFATALVVLLSAIIGLGYWYFFIYSPTVKQIESIAVMPFVNESGNADIEYLSDGMTETLINSLSQLPNLSVKARSSVFRYKGREIEPKKIASELKVQAILNGRVIQRGDDLILYLELVDPGTGDRIWGDQYNKKLTNLIALQTEIARDVSNKLKTKLSGADEQRLAKNHTANPEAYKLYLQGRFHWNKRNPNDLQKSIDYFRQSIALDPNYALAYSGLADAFSVMPDQPMRNRMPQAKEAALTAVRLDETLAEAHASLGNVYMHWDYDFAGAEREFKRAIELNPNYVMALFWNAERLVFQGKFDEGIIEKQRALEIEPFSIIVNWSYGMSLYSSHRYDEALTQMKKTSELDPNFQRVHYGLSLIYRAKGDYAAAIEEIAKTHELAGHPEKSRLVRESFARGGWLEFQRLVITENSDPNRPSYEKALAYVQLGEKDKALAELNRLYENREYGLILLKAEPGFDPLRDDPHFKDLRRRMNLPE